MMKNIDEKLKDIIKNIIDDPTAEINSDTNLINDLGMESLGIVTLMIEIEDKFNITLPDTFFMVDVFSDYGKILNIIQAICIESEKEGGEDK